MDFGKLTFRIDEVPVKKLVIDVYPELKEYSEFENPEHDIHLRVCFFATDPESPFVRLEREDYERRLTKIFEYLKLSDSKLFNSIASGYDRVYENMVNRFFMTFCDNLAYLMWADKLRMFYFISRELRKPLPSEGALEELTKRTGLDKKQKEIYDDLVEYESKVFPDIPTRKKLRKSISKLIQPAEKHAVAKQVV